MKYEKLVIEKKEFLVLKQLLNIEEQQKETTVKNHILKLREELKEAIFLDEDKMYTDVVRLNSLITVCSEDGNWKNTFQLVLPSKSNSLDKKISILLPMGSAVIGYAKGDIIQWEFPGGIKSLQILDVKKSIN